MVSYADFVHLQYVELSPRLQMHGALCVLRRRHTSRMLHRVDRMSCFYSNLTNIARSSAFTRRARSPRHAAALPRNRCTISRADSTPYISVMVLSEFIASRYGLA